MRQSFKIFLLTILQCFQTNGTNSINKSKTKIKNDVVQQPNKRFKRGREDESDFLTNSENQSKQLKLEVLFTPGQPCTQRIIDHINQAKSEILVQAYYFTSTPIIDALIDARTRNINMKITILLDKSQKKNKYLRRLSLSELIFI